MHHVAPIVEMLRNSLPWISFQSGLLIEWLVLTGGRIGPSRGVAQELGFQTRFALTRALRKEHLPSLPRLSAWIRLLIWTWRWEHDHQSLGPTALNNGDDPAACYRLIRRMTNKNWSTVRELGAHWVLRSLLEDCTHKKKSGGVAPAALMRQARGLTRTSVRPLC
jgi:hypothetical protein